jgi:hypothetical protein
MGGKINNFFSIWKKNVCTLLPFMRLGWKKIVGNGLSSEYDSLYWSDSVFIGLGCRAGFHTNLV